MKGIFHEELGTIARFGRRICRSDGGTSLRLNAQTAQSNGTSVQAAPAGIVLVKAKNLPKHACKGQNDCKGQGGGKHPGKNSCKGKGDCATDGSKPPKAA
jgi:hypothetical protein